MKKHTFPITVTCILLASAVLLTGCMFAVAESKGTPKPYTTEIAEQIVAENSSDNSVIDPEPPVPQSEMQKKFGVYLHGQKNNTVQIFSEEQYDELKAVRDRGERIPLTYDEVLYLISDSINLYFKYDTVVLTQAIVDRIAPLQYYGIYSTNALSLDTYHGDYSEQAELSDAYKQYNDTVRDIWMIVFYRLYVHDAGLEYIDRITDAEGNEHSFFVPASGSSIFPNILLLSLDGSTVSGDENREKLQRELGKYLPPSSEKSSLADTPSQPLTAPLVFIKLDDILPSDFSISIISPELLQKQTVFPTAELIARQPEKELSLTASMTVDGGLRPLLWLDRTTGRFAMIRDASISFAVAGKFTEEGDYLTLYPENMDASDVGTYTYVFYKQGVACDAYVYRRNASTPYEGYDFPDGMAFCRDYKDYLLKRTLTKRSGVTYSTQDDSLTLFATSLLRNVELDFGNGEMGHVTVDMMAIPEFIAEQKHFPELILGVGEYHDGKLRATFETRGELLKVSVFTPNGTGFTETETTLDALSDLPDGEYYLALDVRTYDDEPCDGTYLFTDVFRLIVKPV